MCPLRKAFPVSQNRLGGSKVAHSAEGVFKIIVLSEKGGEAKGGEASGMCATKECNSRKLDTDGRVLIDNHVFYG